MQNQFHTLCLLGQEKTEHEQRDQRRSQTPQCERVCEAKRNYVAGPDGADISVILIECVLHLLYLPVSCPPADIKVKEQSFENMAK